MSYATLNGQRIISGSITVPYVGTWVADLVLASAMTLATAGQVSIGNLTLTGTVIRSAAFSGARSVRMVGGAGGWRQPIAARQYANANGVRLSMVLQDAAADTGETVSLANGADRAVGPFYVRASGLAQTILRQLAGTSWWVDATGVTRVGSLRAAPAIATAFQVIKYSGGRGAFEISTEDLASWQPGATFTAPTVKTPTTISVVTHRLENKGSIRTEVLST